MADLSEKREIIIHGSSIKYTLTRKKVKNINLRIKTSGEIFVSANKLVSIKRIENFIIANSDFILRSMKKFHDMNKFTRPKTEYISGEQFMLLGKPLTLILTQSENERVYTDGDYLHLSVINTVDYNKKEKLIRSFYSEKSTLSLNKIVAEIYPLFKKLGIEYPLVKYRIMTSRWGSCIPSKNQINLNKRLIEVPIICSEYVVLHEFSHFIHPNHSKDFYALVATLMPDWKERKKLLDTFCIKNSCM